MTDSSNKSSAAGWIIALIIIAAIIIVWVLVAKPYASEPIETPTSTPSPTSTQMLAYSNAAYAIAFRYPSHYLLREGEAGTAQRGHYRIVLIEDTAENRQLFPTRGLAMATTTPPREGPVAISVDIYQNDLEQQTVEQWIRNTSSSNFKQGPQTLASSTVDRVPALQFTWSGLYEGTSVVFEHSGSIIDASVTYQNTRDPILSDFALVMNSFDLR